LAPEMGRPRRVSRRRFLKASLVTAASGLGVGFYTWQIEPHWLEVVTRPLPVEDLPEALDGRTLVQLSDVHVGPRVSDAYVLKTFRTVSALDPDIVVYTGDFVQYEPGIFAHLERIYASPPTGRLGTVASLGNHDYGRRWSQPEYADRIARHLSTVGVRVVRNDVADIGGLQIVGMEDLWAHRFDPARALAARDRTRPAIVLSHNPDTVDRPGWDGFEGWVLSGHTHGGQCKPPFLPPPILPVENRRYTAGEFELQGGRRMYISRGVGHLLQVRFNVRPEVTRFVLTRA